MAFFKHQVDAKANLLNLSVHTCVQNKWVKVCATIVRSVAEDIIFPFMKLLGIDEHEHTSNPDRNWFGVKKFLDQKVPWLEAKVPQLQSSRRFIDKMHARCLTEVIDSLKRQMSVVKFLSEPEENIDPVVLAKMVAAPLGNLGCESNFARLDNRLKTCGGSASLETPSMKAVIHQNGYFSSEEFKAMGLEKRMEVWDWAKNSDAAKSFKQLQLEWLQNVKAAKEVAVQAARKAQEKQATSFNLLLEKMREHGGPLTLANINTLENLNQQQVLLEIRFIRRTTNPNIRQQRLIKVAGGKDYFQMFPLSELKEAVRSHIMPESSVTKSIEELLADVYSHNKYTGKRIRKKFKDEETGTMEWFEGEVTDCYEPGLDALYQIVYDDNDEETLTLGELKECMIPPPA